MSKTSLPLKNLRGVLLLLIVAFHSFSAYIVTQPTTPPAFDLPPYDWRVFPIIDNERWLGFDLFCAFQFLYLMQFMFFLSGLFVWPSLQRKGWKGFLAHRLVRLGHPIPDRRLFGNADRFLCGLSRHRRRSVVVFVLGALDGAADHADRADVVLVVLDRVGFLCGRHLQTSVGRRRLRRRSDRENHAATAKAVCDRGLHHGARLSAALGALFAVVLGADRALRSAGHLRPEYAIYFFVGLAIGAQGLDCGIFDEEGTLVRRWPLWTAGAFAAFFLWIIPAALIAKVPNVPVKALSVIGDLGLVIFAAAACLSMTGLFQRFARGRLPVIGDISEHGYGVYFFHYPILLWLQYALLDQAMPAVAKGMLVLTGTVFASWGASVLTDRVLTACRPVFKRAAWGCSALNWAPTAASA